MKVLLRASALLAAALFAAPASAITVDISVLDGDQNQWRPGSFVNDGEGVTFRIGTAIVEGDSITDFHIRLLGGVEFVTPDLVILTSPPAEIHATEYQFDGSNFDAIIVAPDSTGFETLNEGTEDEETVLVHLPLMTVDISAAYGQTVDFQYMPTTTGTIPLPAPALLLIGGLGALGGLARRAGGKAGPGTGRA